MTKRTLRIARTGAACVAVLALVVAAMPAAAMPARTGTDDASSTIGWVHALAHRLDGITAWLGDWLEGPAPQSVSARGGGTIDPNGQAAPTGPEPGDDGGVGAQGRGTMDPNG